MKHLVLLGDLETRHRTHRELVAAVSRLPGHIRVEWVGTDAPGAQRTRDADGLWLYPGSPYRDDAAVFAAIEAARSSGQPFLGTCGGLQYAVVEFARNVAGVADADHAETAVDGGTLVIERLACSLVGQERTVTPVPGTKMHALCGDGAFHGFHWCGFGVAPSWVSRLTDHGLVIGAWADDAGVEAIELAGAPFYMATLFQPQVGALDGHPLHPVIRGFVEAL